MLLDKGKVQTKYIKRNLTSIDWHLADRIEVETTLIQSVSFCSVTTRLIKVKYLAVVNRVIFSTFEV